MGGRTYPKPAPPAYQPTDQDVQKFYDDLATIGDRTGWGLSYFVEEMANWPPRARSVGFRRLIKSWVSVSDDENFVTMETDRYMPKNGSTRPVKSPWAKAATKTCIETFDMLACRGPFEPIRPELVPTSFEYKKRADHKEIKSWKGLNQGQKTALASSIRQILQAHAISPAALIALVPTDGELHVSIGDFLIEDFETDKYDPLVEVQMAIAAHAQCGANNILFDICASEDRLKEIIAYGNVSSTSVAGVPNKKKSEITDFFGSSANSNSIKASSSSKVETHKFRLVADHFETLCTIFQAITEDISIETYDALISAQDETTRNDVGAAVKNQVTAIWRRFYGAAVDMGYEGAVGEFRRGWRTALNGDKARKRWTKEAQADVAACLEKYPHQWVKIGYKVKYDPSSLRSRVYADPELNAIHKNWPPLDSKRVTKRHQLDEHQVAKAAHDDTSPMTVTDLTMADEPVQKKKKRKIIVLSSDD